MSKKIILLFVLMIVSCTSESESQYDEENMNEILTVTVEILGKGNSAPDYATGVYLYHYRDSDEGWIDNEVIVNDGINGTVALPYNKKVKIRKHPEGGKIVLVGGFRGCVSVNKLDLLVNGERICRKHYTSRSLDCSFTLYDLTCVYEY